MTEKKKKKLVKIAARGFLMVTVNLTLSYSKFESLSFLTAEINLFYSF